MVISQTADTFEYKNGYFKQANNNLISKRSRFLESETKQAKNSFNGNSKRIRKKLLAMSVRTVYSGTQFAFCNCSCTNPVWLADPIPDSFRVPSRRRGRWRLSLGSTNGVAAEKRKDKRLSVCTADELHYVSVPNSDWILALWRYLPSPQVLFLLVKVEFLWYIRENMYVHISSNNLLRCIYRCSRGTTRCCCCQE